MTKKMTNSNTALYAFWKYDLYPYLLGGKVVHFSEDGNCVQVEGYGGSWFHYVFLLPDPAGPELKESLKKITEGRKEQLQELEDEFKQGLRLLLGNRAELVGLKAANDKG